VNNLLIILGSMPVPLSHTEITAIEDELSFFIETSIENFSLPAFLAPLCTALKSLGKGDKVAYSLIRLYTRRKGEEKIGTTLSYKVTIDDSVAQNNAIVVDESNRNESRNA
jgi:hypothetical protein